MIPPSGSALPTDGTPRPDPGAASSWDRLSDGPGHDAAGDAENRNRSSDGASGEAAIRADPLPEHPPRPAEPHPRSAFATFGIPRDPAVWHEDLLADTQVRKLRGMLATVAGRNPFYDRKFREAGLDPLSVRDPAGLAGLPFTTKADLVADQKSNPPYGSNLTWPEGRYVRLHQTSGTTDVPVRWLDTEESWAWFLACWREKLVAMGLRPGVDRLFFPFSFGPFVGFWAAFEGAYRCGYRVLSGGAMTSTARLRFLADHGATVVFATPTYALHLAEVAAKEGVDLRGSKVRALVVAGEPGGHIPETRAALESAWGARVFDHCGMTEMGPTCFECEENPADIHLLETDYIAEFVEPGGTRPVPDGAIGELVLTNLGRWGSPLIRYRTGDFARGVRGRCVCGRVLMRLAGGLLGRVDDMVHIRGNNFYPSALESVVRRFPEVAEFRVEIRRTGAMTEVHVELEPVSDSAGAGRPLPAGDAAMAEPAGLAARVGRAIQDRLAFRAEVRTVPAGSLPRFELKARRVVKTGDR